MEDKDHDLLIRIDSNLDSLKDLVEKHIEDDDTRFNGIFKRIRNNERWIWTGVGIILLAQFAVIYVRGG